jgi:hypothetical protein
MKRIRNWFIEWVKRHIVDTLPDDDYYEFSNRYR